MLINIQKINLLAELSSLTEQVLQTVSIIFIGSEEGIVVVVVVVQDRCNYLILFPVIKLGMILLMALATRLLLLLLCVNGSPSYKTEVSDLS